MTLQIGENKFMVLSTSRRTALVDLDSGYLSQYVGGVPRPFTGAIRSDAIKRYGVVISAGCCHWRHRRVAVRGLSSRRPSRR